MIYVEETLDTNFINVSNDTLSGHTATVTDTIDSSSLVVEIETTERDDIELVR